MFGLNAYLSWFNVNSSQYIQKEKQVHLTIIRANVGNTVLDAEVGGLSEKILENDQLSEKRLRCKRCWKALWYNFCNVFSRASDFKENLYWI